LACIRTTILNVAIQITDRYSPQPTERNRGKELPAYTKFCIVNAMVESRPVEFRGSALDDLRAFPAAARREAGYQLDQVQRGREPDDWKPMNTVGRWVREIRIRDTAGAFRVLYVAKFDDAVYVLHCFQKKTQKTSKADLNLAAQRYRDLLKELDQ
jgi:phage-related protein